MVDIQYCNNYWRTWSITSLLDLVFRRRRAVFILLAMPPTSLERAALGLWCDWFKPLLEIRHAAALTTGAKHRHRQKAVFYVFVFDSTHDSGNNAESIPRNVPLNHRNAPTCWGGEIKKKEIGGWFPFFVVETKGFEPLTSAMWLQRSKPAGLRLYFRLAMQSNKKFGDLATYWRFFLSWSGIFSGFS